MATFTVDIKVKLDFSCQENLLQDLSDGELFPVLIGACGPPRSAARTAPVARCSLFARRSLPAAAGDLSWARRRRASCCVCLGAMQCLFLNRLLRSHPLLFCAHLSGGPPPLAGEGMAAVFKRTYRGLICGACERRGFGSAGVSELSPGAWAGGGVAYIPCSFWPWPSSQSPAGRGSSCSFSLLAESCPCARLVLP